MKRIAVTGGGGRLGNVVVRQLRERGDRVTVLDALAAPPSLHGWDLDFVRGSVLDASVVVSHEKASRELGFEPRATRAALEGALEFYRATGWVTE